MPTNLGVDTARFLSRFNALARIGATPEGGCRRLALSDEDRQGRDWLVSQMRSLGMDVSVDRVGNIVGVLKGETEGPAVIMGSHIDTVGSGGRYDGATGVVAGLEVIATLRDAGMTPKRDMAVIAFTNEEGARFHPDILGSFVWAGGLSVAAAYAETDAAGAVFGEELRRIGYMGEAEPGFLKAHAYFELHIEQGPVLDQEGGGIGAVTGIQAITWLEVTILGQPNHGGTTPMKYRRDAGLCAARLNIRAYELTQRIEGQLANMGVIRVEPANVNVVPERVIATFDLRNPSDARLNETEAALKAYAKELAAETGVSVTFRDLARFPATPFAESHIASVEASAKLLGLPVRRMISGAGHDAQMMAQLCPTAMIFMPSVDGLSHNPKEFTTDADLVNGVNVLLLAALDAANA